VKRQVQPKRHKADQDSRAVSQKLEREAETYPIFHTIDPLRDNRWPEFLNRHSQASVFHTPAWLAALQRTYGYQPVAFTTTPEGEPLDDGVPFCIVKTWLVRPRLVSLPFSDHAQPLVRDEGTLQGLLAFLETKIKAGQWASVEFRPPNTPAVYGEWANFADGPQYVLHSLDLSAPLEGIFRGFNKDSTQRKIRKAERSGLVYQEGQSEELLQDFFRLAVITRQRQGVPPPPIEWYRNVVGCFGRDAKIRVARTQEGKLAGAILTLSFKQTMLFKYGASNTEYHRLGTVPFLLWKAIEDAKNSGANTFDFGRSEIEHAGLILFKTHFGGEQKTLTHKVYPARAWAPSSEGISMRAAKRVFGVIPHAVFIKAGRLIYPHIG
jgi:CelD/BcsL family acetyltransferase involved in cellulose biosynthesis